VIEFFDSHTHLESDRFAQDRQAVIARAASAGVTRVLSCGSDLVTSRQNIEIAEKHAGIYAAVGVHAHQANSLLVPGSEELDVAKLAQLCKLYANSKVVAVGEVGLDYHYNFSPPSVQHKVLRHELELAQERDLPVVLHNRESDADMRAVVDGAAGPLRGVLHCFLADEAMAEWALAKGLYIGVAGPITFSNVRHLAAIVKGVPRDRLLIETDCPYLAPHPMRGKRNEPAFVAHVAAKLAEILGCSLEELAAQTHENACRLFGIV